jgi:hypothetical protein
VCCAAHGKAKQEAAALREELRRVQAAEATTAAQAQAQQPQAVLLWILSLSLSLPLCLGVLICFSRRSTELCLHLPEGGRRR